MSNQARQELLQLEEIVQQTLLTDKPDRRLSPFSRSPDRLDTSTIYRLLKAKGQPDDPASVFIWKNAAPSRVQFFVWLLIKGRIQCRANLFRKKIIDSSACLACRDPLETPDHIMFGCPFAAQFWSAVGLQASQNPKTSDLHTHFTKHTSHPWRPTQRFHQALLLAALEEKKWCRLPK